MKRLQELAADDTSPTVRLYLTCAAAIAQCSSLGNRIGIGSSWRTPMVIYNLPLMIWYGTEPLVADDPKRAIELALKSSIPQVREYIFLMLLRMNLCPLLWRHWEMRRTLLFSERSSKK